MSDYERYSDYNHIGEDNIEDVYPPPLWIKILRVMFRVMLISVCVLVCGILGFRLILSGWYPAAMKRLHVTEPMRAVIAEKGELDVYTQTLVVPYEDRATGFFIADNMFLVKDTGSLQISVRTNVKQYSRIAEHYKVECPEDLTDFLVFTLHYNNQNDADSTNTPTEIIEITYTPTKIMKESHMGYDYYKICFDGISLADNIPWYRLNIHIKGYEDTEKIPAASIVIYENNPEYSKFTPYTPSKKELGQ
ncbi:MAG: hypothetical protein J6R42_00665 [Clostridia bacterium]|nr:hypothetical protein [Clostridia bacterium]